MVEYDHLLTKADLEQELKTAFAGTYTDNYFTELANYALGELESATSRTAFTGSSSYLAKKAMICAAMEWISMFDRALFELAISSISENGASISFQVLSKITKHIRKTDCKTENTVHFKL